MLSSWLGRSRCGWSAPQPLRSSGRSGGPLGLPQSRGCPSGGQEGMFRDALSGSGEGPDGWHPPSAAGRRPAAASATPPVPDQVAWGEGKTVTQGGVADSKRHFCTLRITKLAVKTFRCSFWKCRMSIVTFRNLFWKSKPPSEASDAHFGNAGCVL